MPKRRFHHGPLTLENVEDVAQAIAQKLAGKVFAVCATNTNEGYLPRMSTDLHLQTDWTDEEPVLVRAHKDDESALIHFSDDEYSYVYTSRCKSGGNHENFKHPYVLIRRDEIFFQERIMGGYVRTLMLSIQKNMPCDVDEIPAKNLKIHLTLAGRAACLADHGSPNLQRPLKGTPEFVFFEDRRESHAS